MKRDRYELVAVALTAVIILAVRDVDGFLRPDFWAEDGRVFFRGWNNDGWASFAVPYAGYLHLFPRTIAAIAGLLPLAWTLHVFLIGAVIVTAWACVTIFLCFRDRSRIAAWLAALTPLLAFGGSEVLGTPTNLQWLTAIVLAAIAVSGRGSTANKGIMTVAAGLSGPFSFLFLPVFAARLWLVRADRPEAAVSCLALLCGFVQGAVILSHPQGPGFPPVSALLGTMADLLRASLGSPVGFVTLAALVLGLTAGEHRRERWALCFLAAVIVASIAVKFAGTPGIFDGGAVGHRYWYIPSGLWLISLALLIAEPRGWLRRAGIAGLVCFLVGYAFTPFLIPEDRHYGTWEEGMRTGTYTYPPGKVVPVPPR